MFEVSIKQLFERRLKPGCPNYESFVVVLNTGNTSGFRVPTMK